MNCPVCRTHNISGISYCIKCGKKLEDVPETDYGYIENDRQSQYVSEDLFVHEESENNNDFYFGSKPETEETALKSQPYAENVSNSVPLQAQPYKDMYGKPPQIIGYDMNGVPVYSQPVYQQSQIIGYDMNGVPVYSQPIYPRSQIIGYDGNGKPVYSRPLSYPQSRYIDNVNQPEVDENAEKFRDFLGDGSGEKSVLPKEEDFFGKTSEMDDVVLPDLDIGGLKKREKNKNPGMGEVEVQDAGKLIPNDVSKFNQKYMRQVSESGSGDLGEKKDSGEAVKMTETQNADSRQLNPNLQYKTRDRMGNAENHHTDDFNTRTIRRRKITMAEADHAVEAMPKKKKYVDELDLIELPEYMKARKKKKKDKPEYPEMSEL
ncbi:MAG: hypothetical protein K2G36_01230 [Ruminococcus sp.]|nr:hypothetical protein [Ruminococcus sp.]